MNNNKESLSLKPRLHPKRALKRDGYQPGEGHQSVGADWIVQSTPVGAGPWMAPNHYCLKKLVEKGWVKAKNFHNSNNKTAYAYLLSPKGIEEKGKLTIEFLQRKMVEYEMLKGEIAQLQEDVEK